ncbi:uncharacterized protein LOC110713178 [Chenopodium quinoa]|uniref:uncharacterized protein LOC110713178 n=1 Tax=Chenopodium quinoa TaxID=63459 RepID=UPI000B78027F|nr:uncharacterized protein LOC110713178 [Chenopodium quinoa]
MNKKVTAESLADRYLEEFRSNPTWKIRQIQERALTDLGIKVSYFKAWLARCRAKLIIFCSSAEQYAKVWDYAKALVVHNPGTGCVVVVDGIEQPEPPLFLRMFVCLAPLRDGFVSGCRPIIGVDGCHLKGAYPGQILVVVAKDGNNHIFPLAWATVEIENKDTWSWFLEALVDSIGGKDEGEGLTFMSDRPKGLLEAFENVVPKAETRYCVRHIWSNFKQQFQGSLFKELFWNVARAYTHYYNAYGQTDFEVAMESINFLSEEAYDYLANIPPQHWSRHAFSPTCKSNMLLNNLCETFNAVIRDARDKPILTQMEWLRRCMMKRTNDKWMAASEWEGLCVPYVKKVFDGLEKYARTCTVQSGWGELYEVEYKDDTCVVNLEARTCTCYRWDLTGLPCVHAFAALLDKRVDPELYVHPYYHIKTYLAAYETPIQPMPGAKHWDKVHMREPMPPAFKVQPGRSKAKKRKLEQGEGSSAPNSENKKVKRRNQCKNCGGFGHYAKTCSLDPAPTPVQVQNTAPSGGRPALDNPWMKEQRRKSELRAMKKSAALGATAGPNSIGNKKFPQELAKEKAAEASSACNASQPTEQVQPSAMEASASQPMTRSRTKLTEASHTSASQPLPRQQNTRHKLSVSKGLHQHQFMHKDDMWELGHDM